jgi:large subunit ribosomal protein L33
MIPMAKAKRADSLIALKCSVCKRRNYYTHKNKKSVERKIDLKKYCNWCRLATSHKETKITAK